MYVFTNYYLFIYYPTQNMQVRISDTGNIPHVTITGEHEERSDEHGFVSRKFTRRYAIPSDVDPSAITCDLSNNGLLTLHAPRMALTDTGSRAIPITYAGEQQQRPNEGADKMQERKSTERAG
jgi:crystallin alpha A